MCIRFPAILLVKTIDSYLHEFCARGILHSEERMKTSLTEEKWKQFEQPLFGRFEFFQRWQLELK